MNSDFTEMDLQDFSSYMLDNARYTFILVVIDLFSKFIFVRPLLKKTPIQVANCLQNIFFENGAPLILQSDNGLEFTTEPILELCKKFKIEQRRSFHCVSHLVFIHLTVCFIFFSDGREYSTSQKLLTDFRIFELDVTDMSAF